jgi:ABC-2 type transport system ATP-binding protein
VSDEPVIAVRDLRKSYEGVEAVAGIDLQVDVGEVFALLGPNGAGKTTTVEILEGFRARSAGDALVLGHDPGRHDEALRRRIGIVLQSTGVDPYLTVRETVEMYSGYYPAPRPAGEVIDLVGLDQKRDTRVLKLSGGQQRRLDVAIALAGDPELLFLDEPTTGFDPTARRAAWEIVRDLTTLGKTVFLTTHFMDEAQYLADRVAVITRGRIVAEGPPATLAGRDRMLARVAFRVAEPDGLPSLGQVPDGEGGWELRVDDPTRVLHELTGWALDHGVTFEALDVTRPSLEDVYLEITGAEGAEGAAHPAGAEATAHE